MDKDKEKKDSESAENANGTPDSLKVEPVKSNPETEKVAYDTTLTNIAKLIAGMPVEAGSDSLIHAIQQKKFYTNHKNFTNTTWETTNKLKVQPVQKWAKKKNIGDDRKGTTVFYPLSGPDFLYGYTFYPRAHEYIMIGLERKGSLPPVSEMSDGELDTYLSRIRGSMKYLNTHGYFVTSYMGSDFAKQHLNGTLHHILYFLARTNHKVVDVHKSYIQEDGTLKKLEDIQSAPKGKIVIQNVVFTGKNQLEKKKVMYIRLDVSDKNLAKHPEFEKFVRNQTNRVAYMKSASCVLFNPGFETMRQLVMSSDKLIQDDTGVPYRYLTANGTFDINLYGTYTSVIDDLKWCIQKDMMKALKEEGENKPLPFKISYNGHHDEGMILYAVKKKKGAASSDQDEAVQDSTATEK